jgi:hypothetical protein
MDEITQEEIAAAKSLFEKLLAAHGERPSLFYGAPDADKSFIETALEGIAEIELLR